MMPANNQSPAAPTPASPRNTAKYTNKDGSKFITVPKGSPSDTSPPPTPTTIGPKDAVAAPSEPAAAQVQDAAHAAPAVNRKKQKRRQKAAAKAAAEMAPNGHASPASVPSSRQDSNLADSLSIASDDDEAYAIPPGQPRPPLNGGASATSKSKRNRKKKKRAASGAADGSPADFDADLNASPMLPAIADAQATRGPGMSRDKIWSTSNHEERERIKEFWLGLGEDERKSLVKVEKDAVLKKMKEQQKHTCSCTVCGRKRTAIEEELEGLYDAYYLELEQFANQGEGPPMLPPPRDFPLRPPRGIPTGFASQPPSRGRIVEHVGDDVDDEEELDEVYSEDEVDDDEYSDDEPPEAFHSSHDRDVADFLTFGNSLQVKGGILTVADDLLKNDGKRFIEMMEQLAERRMAREEDAREHFSRGYGHPNGSYAHPHNHPPPEDDDYEDDEEDEEEDDEEDYEESQDEEYEDEEDQMTEEQRMEEGRRMFQIFAARMFEQRVLSAYKEKVAKERQQRLLEELEEESRQVDEQKAKKAKNAQKKKDKAAQRKQAVAEEKARKEAEKAADEAARVEAEAKRAAEQKQKTEEKRKQKEAQRKAEEESRLKKEAERLRRVHEQREKQAEQERKARESKEREKKAKEEQRQKEKEAREQREREAQERKDKQERDKREKEARAAKAQKNAQEATEAKAKARDAIHKNAAVPGLVPPQVQVAKRTPSQPHPVTIPTVLPQHPPNPASYVSPKVPVATPALPKAPTPARPRAPSQQDITVAGRSPSLSSIPNTPAHTSPGSIGQERKPSFGTNSGVLPSGLSVSPPGLPSSFGAAPFQGPPLAMQQPPGLGQHPPPGFANRMPQDPLFSSGLRPAPGMMMSPSGMNGPVGRGVPAGPMGPPGFSSGIDQFSQGYGLPKDVTPPAHTRQGSFEGPSSMAQPIGRPAPIGRPGSTSHGRSTDEEDEAKHLGSRALLEDDEPLEADLNPGSLRNHPPGLSRGFPGSPFMDNAFPIGHSPWAPTSSAGQGFPPPGFGSPGWGAPSMPPGFAVGSPSAGMAPIRASSQPRHVAVRLMLCKACRDLSSAGNCDSEGFADLTSVHAQVEAQSGDTSIAGQDLLNLCDTEGSSSNGGGTFDVRRDANGAGKHAIRWVPDAGMTPQFRAVGAPGEIGSPLVSYASMRGI